MKKIELKSLLKLGILLFGISFFFNSCEKDDIIDYEEHGIIAESPKSNITYNQFQSLFNNSRYTSKSSFNLDKYKFGSNCSVFERNDSESIINYIDTTNIVSFQYNNISTFTFKAETTIDSTNTFVNIIISQTNDGTNTKLIKYVANTNWLNDNELDYSGEVYEIDEFGEIIVNYSNDSSLNGTANRTFTDCAFSVSTVTVNCTGTHADGSSANHSNSGDCNCDAPGSSCSPPYTYSSANFFCVTTVSGGGPADDSGNGGGYYETDPYQNPDGTYNLPDNITPSSPVFTIVPHSGVINTLTQNLNLNFDDFTFLNDNPKIARSFFNYLHNNGNTNVSAINSIYKVLAIFKGDANSSILSTPFEHKSYLLMSGDYLTLINFNLFSEYSLAFSDVANNTILNQADLELISSRIDEIYNITEQYSFGRNNLLSSISLTHQETLAKNSAFIALLPEVKSLVGDHWPQTAEQWSAIGTIMGQFMVEIGLAVIPGSSIIDVTSGLASEDYVAVTVGVVGLFFDAYGGAIIKVIGKIGKAVYKTFKIFKIVFKYLDIVVDAITLGYKTDLINGAVKISNSVGTKVAEIQDNIIKFVTNSAKSLIKVADLKLLKKVDPTPNGFISKGKLDADALRIKPENPQYQSTIDDIIANGDPNGDKTEGLIETLLHQDGYLPPKQSSLYPDDFDVHLPGNKGFDNVLIKRDNSGNITDIIINESKQVSNAGSVSLSNGVVGTAGSTCSGCTQMSTDWIDDVLVRMDLQGGDLQTLASEINDFVNISGGTITQLVSGVNKSTGELVLTNITGF